MTGMGTMTEDRGTLARGGRAGQDDLQTAGLGLPRSHRRPPWVFWTAMAALYAVGGMVAFLLPPAWIVDLTLYSYAVAEAGGLAFILRYLRTDWRTHPWGRHVMAFMVCLEVLFTLALSRRIFGQWPGLPEVGLLASATFAAIIWWRFLLQRGGDHRIRAAERIRRLARRSRVSD